MRISTGKLHDSRFAFCHLLGTVRLMPRLKRLEYERLHLPDNGMVDEYPDPAGIRPRHSRGFDRRH